LPFIGISQDLVLRAKQIRLVQSHEANESPFGIPVCFKATIRVNMCYRRSLGNEKSTDENAAMTVKGLTLSTHEGDAHTLASGADTFQTLAERRRCRDTAVPDPTTLVAHRAIGSSAPQLGTEKDIPDADSGQAVAQLILVELRPPPTVRGRADVCDCGDMRTPQERYERVDRMGRVSYGINGRTRSHH
jgi:hypothetical protein